MEAGLVKLVIEYGQELGFFGILVIVLYGSHKMIMYLLKMLKEKQEDIRDLTKVTNKSLISQERIANFLDLLLQRSNSNKGDPP